jgi:cell division protein FtsB
MDVIRRGFWVILCLGWFGYIGYHAVQGERGWLALQRLEKQKASWEARLAEVSQLRERREQQVRYLRGQTLDKDLLDEQVRGMFGWVDPDEIIVTDQEIMDPTH